jgi:hypothetical protein
MRAALSNLDEGEFTEGHELDLKWKVPEAKTNDMMSWWRALGQSGGALALISIQAYGGPRQSFSL